MVLKTFVDVHYLISRGNELIRVLTRPKGLGNGPGAMTALAADQTYTQLMKAHFS